MGERQQILAHDDERMRERPGRTAVEQRHRLDESLAPHQLETPQLVDDQQRGDVLAGVGQRRIGGSDAGNGHAHGLRRFDLRPCLRGQRPEMRVHARDGGVVDRPAEARPRRLAPAVIGARLARQVDAARERDALAAAEPQVIIDTGEAKEGLEEDMDTLQEQLGIPVVFVECAISDYGAAYETLGKLLGMEERGNELAAYCRNAYDEVQDVMASIPEEERANLLYILGEDGTNVLGKGVFQAQVVDMCADNLAVMDNASNQGQGSETSLEQIALWNPDIIVFASGSIYGTVADDPAWDGIAAIDNGNYYEAPGTPYNWLNYPPTVNQVMGMQWLPRLLYPDKFDDSIADVTKSYYSTFYGYDLSDEELDELIANAVPKA